MKFYFMLSLLLALWSSATANMVGGQSMLSEQQFSDASEIGFDFKLLINSGFEKSSAGTNQPPLKYFSYICGTKQVVAGMKYKVEFLACSRKDNGDCDTEVAPSKCTVTYVSQIWLVRGAPTFDGTQDCTKVKANDLGSIAECSLMPKRAKNHNLFSPTLTMEKSDKYDADAKAQFDKFIEKYNKPYNDPTSDMYHVRYNIFAKNLKIVRDMNKLELGTATYDVNEFTDYSEEEYRRYLAPGLMERKVEIRSVDANDISVKNLPASVDWRNQGAVTEVKNQGQCGSCWAFSTTGNIEGQWFIAKKQLVSLSEQELVDCDTVDQGCDGGLPSNAYKQIEKLGGLETEKEYPYEGEDDKCEFKKSDIRVYINDSVSLPTDEDKLAEWLAQHGPISIGINANAMQFYFGGISHPWSIFCNPNKLDHGVLIVGYGTDDGTPFWIIKNSWGASWGEKGYYRIFRGGGCCGLNREATSALVK